MKTFIINLDKCKDKKEYIVNLCNHLKLDFEIFNAVDGSKLSDSFIQENVYDYPACSLTKGEIGCALSHIGIYKEIIDRKLPYALILEDDAILDHRTTDFIKIFNKKLNKQGIYLLTGDFTYTKKHRIKMDKFEIFPVTKAVRATGYIITKEAAKKLLEFLFPIRYEADMFEIFYACANIKIYAALPHLIGTNDHKKEFSYLEAERKPLFTQREKYRAELFTHEKMITKKNIFSWLSFFKRKNKTKHYSDY